jgi:hypothetical protein
MADQQNLTCLDCGLTDKSVTQTTTPDRRDFKTFPRCPVCFDKRYQSAQQTMRRYPESFMGPDPFSDDSWGGF